MKKFSPLFVPARNVPVSLMRRPYTTPVFRVHGAVGQLTQGGVISTRSDSGNNSMRPGA